MESLRKQKIKAYILLESVLALGVFAMITTLMIGQMMIARREQVRILQEEEALQVAHMALQTQQSSLALNGQDVQVHRGKEFIRVSKDGEELFYVVRQ